MVSVDQNSSASIAPRPAATDIRRGPLVTLDDGQLRGITNGKLSSWRGIPYAAPPTGPLRWRAPQPVTPWEGIRAAADFRNAAPQMPRFTAVGLREYQPIDEDCLTLNVVTLARPATKPRPVMVFIHGGGYLIGTSATPLYLGNSLVERGDLVYVSINYRLGALGYLNFSEYSTADRQFDSNLGLRDQVAALQWVQRNIVAFGGDPNSVTIFGESAGGNAVTTLLATPAAKGLFHRAIAQSSAPGLTVDQARSTQWAREFVDLLSRTEPDPVAKLDGATPGELGKAANRLAGKVGKRTPGMIPFGPTVDGDYLPQDPAVTLAAGQGHQVPLIIGTNASEAALFARLPGWKPSEDHVAGLLKSTDRAVAVDITGSYAEYPKRRGCMRIIGDHFFWAPSVRIGEAHSKHAPTYFYRFDYAPKTMQLSGFGATHATELLAVFGVYRGGFGRTITVLGDRRSALRVTDEMQRDWITFARTGRPASDWPQYNGMSRSTRIIDRRSHVVHDPAAAQRRAWAGYPEAAG